MEGSVLVAFLSIPVSDIEYIYRMNDTFGKRARRDDK